MATPLDRNERYILAYLRSNRVASAHWAWLIAKILTAVVFIAGFVKDDQGLIFTGFGTLLLLDLHLAARQPQQTRVLCSAVAKLEERIEELEKAAAAQ